MTSQKQEINWERSDKEGGVWIILPDRKIFVGNHPNTGPTIKIKSIKTPTKEQLQQFKSWDELQKEYLRLYGVDLNKVLKEDEIRAFKHYYNNK